MTFLEQETVQWPEDENKSSGHLSEQTRINRSVLAPEEIRDDILLTCVDGIGPRLFQRLLQRFECAANILDASRIDLMEVDGIGPRLASQILDARNFPVDDLIARCQREGIDIVRKGDLRYPDQLLTIQDSPVILYVRGQILPKDAFSIAVVGTRGISSYGRRITQRIVTELIAAGFTIISGLARGIDGMAHRTTLQNKGRTLAVLGSGLLNIFPPEHFDLACDIAEQGAVISEFHPLCPPTAGNFPRRNRIVSGLSLGTLVIESPSKGGALITARLAMEQNREVFAVPGPIDQENSRGCHQLIKDGAVLVESINDIITALGPLGKPVSIPTMPAPVHVPAELNLNETEKNLLKYIGSVPVTIDSLIEETGIPASQVLGILAALEFRKIIKRLEGNRVCRG